MSIYKSLFEQSKYTELTILFRDTLNPTPEDSLIAAAAYFKLNDFDNSVLILEPLYPILSDSIDYLSLLGAALRRLGRLDDALRVFKHGVQAAGSNNNAFLNNYSNLLVDLGDISEAITVLQDILKRDPSYEDASLNLTRAQRILAEKNSTTSSLTQVDQFILGDPLDPLLEAFSSAESLYTLQSYLPASKGVSTNIKSDLIKVASSIAKHPLVNEQLDKQNTDLRKLAILNKQVNPKLSLRYCNQLVHNGADPTALYSLVAEAYIHLKDLMSAEKFYLKAFGMGERTLDVLANLAQLANIRGCLSEAQNYLNLALSSYPDNTSLVKLRQQILSNSTSSSNTLLSITAFPTSSNG